MPSEATTTVPGRVCPAGYAYQAGALQMPAVLRADTLYVAGGLYGNPEALDALEALARADIRNGEQVAIVFNGDFHWFDADADWFLTIHERTRQWTRLAGNVELELAEPSVGTGCGCAYPKHIADSMVQRSNAIMQRLQDAAARVDKALPGRLSRLLFAQVGSARVLCLHGDTEAVAGWRFAAENLPPIDSRLRQRLDVSSPVTALSALEADFRACEANIIACSHTCLPVYCRLDVDGTEHILANNGASGMPNFDDMCCGIATRISTNLIPPPDSLFGIAADNLRCDAVKLNYDQSRWLKRFLSVWSEGSSAHVGYFERLNGNVRYSVKEALRDFRSRSI